MAEYDSIIFSAVETFEIAKYVLTSFDYFE